MFVLLMHHIRINLGLRRGQREPRVHADLLFYEVPFKLRRLSRGARCETRCRENIVGVI